ncbi:MAG: L-seryl-tRNA(Sec) selenium transferase [Coriobacteriia bacterium]|nr:L-seryl-tRNA(Sec) selenium transferase [Coriobacteriia bacterium]MCL2537012.1 L-seryl-tRNA(Sec) selenium transferase [Coriobacteriia bacterium]
MGSNPNELSETMPAIVSEGSEGMRSNTTQPSSKPATTQELYRSIPNVDEVMNTPEVEELLLAGVARAVVLDGVRRVLDNARAGIAAGSIVDRYHLERCVIDILPVIESMLAPHLLPVVNATGIVVHTNLGRSVLPAVAREAVVDIIEGYSNLEYDVDAGMRGSRHDHVESLLCELTGAEAAMAVNNNAAAVLLCLAALAGGSSTVVSRGQLVEIGGSFRIPDVMAASGTTMVEVGTTNKTHLKDYRTAIESLRADGREVGLLFKAHTSNYKVTGFSSEVDLEELAVLGREQDVLVAEDLGSGVFVDLAARSGGTLPHEPTVQESLATGADVVTFSGDKLLGGPQAGILCGKAEVIARLKKHPLARAVRLDKMTLAALEATLGLYRDLDQACREVPTLRMLLMSAEECKLLAEELATAIGQIIERSGLDTEANYVSVVKDDAYAGGGSLPDVALASFAVALVLEGKSAAEVEHMMRTKADIPIIGRIKDDRFLLSARTVSLEDRATLLGELEYLLARS